jgi:hypothetical protein
VLQRTLQGIHFYLTPHEHIQPEIRELD